MSGTAAGLYDLLVERGTPTVLSVIWRDENQQPIDLTGYTAKMQIREYREAPDPPLQDYSTTLGTILLQSGGELGLIQVVDDTRLYEWRKGVYDLQMFPPGATAAQAIRILQGKVILDWDTTR